MVYIDPPLLSLYSDVAISITSQGGSIFPWWVRNTYSTVVTFVHVMSPFLTHGRHYHCTLSVSNDVCVCVCVCVLFVCLSLLHTRLIHFSVLLLSTFFPWRHNANKSLFCLYAARKTYARVWVAAMLWRLLLCNIVSTFLAIFWYAKFMPNFIQFGLIMGSLPGICSHST